MYKYVYIAPLYSIIVLVFLSRIALVLDHPGAAPHLVLEATYGVTKHRVRLLRRRLLDAAAHVSRPGSELP